MNCKFYHDPAVAQYGEEERLFERLDSCAELNINQVGLLSTRGTHYQLVRSAAPANGIMSRASRCKYATS